MNTRVILACNTSHLFLPAIYERVPELEGRVVNIIKSCVEEVIDDEVSEVYLLGTEGTIDSRVYQKALGEKKIKCIAPEEAEYPLLRECIEAVKQNIYTEDVKEIFISLVTRHSHCILGCTELPILYEKYHDYIEGVKVYDPAWRPFV